MEVYCLQYRPKNDHQKVKEAILTNYNPDGWPSDSQVQVQVSLAICALQLVSEITSSVVIKVVLRMKWKDLRLQWNPADYNGLQQTTIEQAYKSKRVWMPDISCTTLNGKLMFPDLDYSLIQVSYDGSMYWSRPGSINVA